MALSRRAKKRVLIGGISIAAAAALTGSVVFAADQMRAAYPPPVSTKVQEFYDKNVVNRPTATAKQTTSRAVTISDAMALLKDKSRPWVFAVVGDSTGNAPDEWVYQVVEQLSKTYTRPAVVHNWSIEENKYATKTSVGGGSGEPIIVWNGSASGMNASYSMKHRTVMVPEAPDLMIVNHGHNVADAAQSDREVTALLQWAGLAWKNEPAIAVTLQNPRVDEHAQRQADVVAGLKALCKASSITVIDVYSAFEKAGPAALVQEDGFHPNLEGEKLWASAVLRVLTQG